MSLFRKDPFGRGWVLLSPERGLVPSDFGSVPLPSPVSPLSPGNEARLGAELAAVRPSNTPVGGADWRMRVIAHPARLLGTEAFLLDGAGPFQQAAAGGHHELIVEHPDARVTLDLMPRQHLVDLLRLYRERLALHGSKPGIRHVQITRNVGRAAGALYEHPHAQLLAVPVSNRWVEEELEAGEAHVAATGRCVFCDVIDHELKAKERLISHNDEFVALAPFASKTPFETWILPRRHASDYASVPSNILPALADLLQAVVRSLNDALDSPPYNLALHTSPRSDLPGFHWHIELLPRLTNQSGFDWGAGFYVNPTPPEDAARFLREALALQQVAG